jgi:carbamoyl-phosphate synthase small subunit
MTTSPWTKKSRPPCWSLRTERLLEGKGFGATGAVEAEVCFNTAITGYQEILTDPSYAGQIVTFTFPHIGNIGANDEDIEDLTPARAYRRGRRDLQGRHHRSVQLPRGRTSRRMAEGARHHRPVRHRYAALTAYIRENGVPNAVIAHDPSGKFDIEALKQRPPPHGAGSSASISPRTPRPASPRAGAQTPWVWDEGFGEHEAVRRRHPHRRARLRRQTQHPAAVFRPRRKVTVLPATTSGGRAGA